MVYSTMNDGHGAGGQTVRPRFHGKAKAMFPIVLKGLFLTIVTLGIYRFWYVTDVRRFLWNNTEVDGDLLEYTGRGVELFIGFLIALAVLIPVYALVFLAGAVAGPIGQAIVQFVLTVGIVFLAQYALFRARRYRLTRTIWRGIRFQQTGSGWAYAAKSFGWALLMPLTFGLIYPFMRASLERYKMTNTWYGDQQGAFNATGGQLFKRYICVWLIWVVTLGTLFGVELLAIDRQSGAFAASPVHALIVLVLPVMLVLISVYWAIEFRWWANGCSVGPARARCDLTLFAFFKVYLGYFGVVLLFALVLGALGGAAFYALGGAGLFEAKEPGPAQIGLIAGGAMLYFVIALVFAALWQLFAIRPIWRKSFESVEIAGLPALVAAQSLAPEANAFGEGIADAIDFGGF